MTYLGRLCRRLLERLLGVWHEGPEAPRRLAEAVRMFRHHYPDATPDEWEHFAVLHGDNAYRDAFVRGFQWDARVWPERDINGEEVAVVHAHDASLGDGDPRVRKLLTEIPRSMSPEQKRLIGELAASPYGIRIEFKEESE